VPVKRPLPPLPPNRIRDRIAGYEARGAGVPAVTLAVSTLTVGGERLCVVAAHDAADASQLTVAAGAIVQRMAARDDDLADVALVDVPGARGLVPASCLRPCGEAAAPRAPPPRKAAPKPGLLGSAKSATAKSLPSLFGGKRIYKQPKKR